VANAIDTILHGNYLRETPPWVALLVIVFMAVAAGLISRIQRPSLTLIFMAIGMMLYAAVTYIIFAVRGLYIPFAAPQINASARRDPAGHRTSRLAGTGKTPRPKFVQPLYFA